MTDKEILEKIETIFREFFDNEDFILDESLTSEDIEEWDSVAHIQLIFELEECFDVQFDSEDIPKMMEIKEMIKIVGRELKK